MYDLKRMNFVDEAAERILIEGKHLDILGVFLWDEAPEGTDYWVDAYYKVVDEGSLQQDALDKIAAMLEQYKAEQHATIQ